MHELDNYEPNVLLPLLYLLVIIYCFVAVVLPINLPLFRQDEFFALLFASTVIVICTATIHIVLSEALGPLTPAVAKAMLFSSSIIVLSFSSYIATEAYFAVKPAIPLINSHDYDQTIGKLQRELFYGISPSLWIIHQESRSELQMFDLAYNMFMPFLAASLMIAVYVKGLKGGVQLSIAQFIGLFVCLIVALIFPTRGPIFQHPATFFPRLAHTMSGHLAEYLLVSARTYVQDPSRVPLLAGIAAMPSYHVFSWACGLMYWRHLPRWAFAIGILACALDWLSTVALGWHYALDGAVALLLVYPAWKTSECFMRLATPARAHAGATDGPAGPAPVRSTIEAPTPHATATRCWR